jgi:transcriptional regulator with XRE-family HTH domain
MKQERLIILRKSKGFSQMIMAQKSAMEQTTYSRKEIGKSPITDEEWQKFANVLNTTVDKIKSVNDRNKNYSFSENAIGSVQYISIPQDVLDTVLRYNKKLEEENELLKKRFNP